MQHKAKKLSAHLVRWAQQGRPYDTGGRGRVKAGELKPSPLTLHVNVGDCLKINLKNEMAKARYAHQEYR